MREQIKQALPEKHNIEVTVQPAREQNAPLYNPQ